MGLLGLAQVQHLGFILGIFGVKGLPHSVSLMKGEWDSGAASFFVFKSGDEQLFPSLSSAPKGPLGFSRLFCSNCYES